MNVEVAAARAEKMAADIKEKAAATQVFTGEIESKQTLCPKCGKPAGEGKFCNNCVRCQESGWDTVLWGVRHKDRLGTMPPHTIEPLHCRVFRTYS